MSTRLQQYYNDTIVQEMVSEFGLKNRMMVPRLVKVVLNMGIGEAAADSRHVNVALEDLTLIAGQKAVVTRARKSVAGFKIRENQSIGAKVTLRSAKMYEFLDKLVNIVLPRVKDFRGLSPKSVNTSCYSLGIKDQSVFYEVADRHIDVYRGMDITIVTTADSNEKCLSLLKKINFPFTKHEKNN